MTARCPTCDREGCAVAATGSVEWSRQADIDAWQSAVDDCRAHAVDWRSSSKSWEARALAAEADAARWQRVAPLIERLRVPNPLTSDILTLFATTDRAAPEGATP